MARNSFQGGTVELKKRRGGDVWSIRYRLRDPYSKKGWKHKRELLPECKTEKEARRVLIMRAAEINSSNNSPQPLAMTFADFSSSFWEAYLKNRQIKPSTIYSYRSMLDNFILPEFGKMQVAQIRPADITNFLGKAENRGASTKYRLNLYSLLKVMFEVAVEYELVTVSPVRRKLHRPQYKARKKPALTAEEIRQVLENIPDEYKALFITIALTGQRIGELLALRWTDVDFTTQKLSIRSNLWRGTFVKPKTDASERTLPLPTILRDILLDHRQKSRYTDTSDFIFCKRDGGPCDPDHLRNRVLYPALSATGINRASRSHGFHLFRHSAGSIVHSITRDLKQAQELLGHAHVSTTSDIYVHLDDEVAKETVEALARAIIPNCSLIVPQGSDQIQ